MALLDTACVVADAEPMHISPGGGTGVVGRGGGGGQAPPPLDCVPDGPFLETFSLGRPEPRRESKEVCV